ncbi:MAG: hypothetical protein ACYS1A_10990 [Planctomycetota bacterium]|jgi:hypothetical protein
MIKTIGVVIGGIFIGAVGMEIIHRNFPKELKKFYKKTRRVTSSVKKAFKTGYQNAVLAGKAAASDV